ncbi:MAG: ATP-binding protein [Clostridia bacterium]|nr:ATP-binding protein [Clostridia bacterium]
MKFFGRESELKRIRALIDRPELAAVLIYGRRRVGKSELIRQSLRESNTRSIYYECRQTAQMSNVASLTELICEAFGLPPLRFGGMEECLDYLFRAASDRSLVLVLDEYPYLRESVPGLDSVLQALIDRYGRSSHLKLILCGSFTDVMKSLLANDNPLYGRIDLTIDLKPMDYLESALFYPDFSAEDKVRLFSVFGGIPYYNRLIDGAASVRENIAALIASPGARLENEVSMFLRSEISKITNANEVFETLAKGYSRFNDILSQSHVSSSPTLADVLDKLTRMELVEKQTPINDETNRKKGGYYISDQLSGFFYRYVFRNASRRALMDENVFWERYIQEDFEKYYVPKAFETVCRQYLIRQNRKGLLPEVFDRIGKYWYDDPASRTNGEFDVVTKDPKGYVFYEAKFRKGPLTGSMIREEIAQVEKTQLHPYRYGFFSRSGFSASEADERVTAIPLEAVYAN